MTQNQVSCRLPEYFPDPDAFIPERWFAKGEINPFLVLPFGHGPRACIARRMAEQNMYTVIIQVNIFVGFSLFVDNDIYIFKRGEGVHYF